MIGNGSRAHGRTRLRVVSLLAAAVVLLTLASVALASHMTVTIGTSQADPVVGESVTYTANHTGGTGPYTYSWSKDDASVPSESGKTLTTTWSTVGSHPSGIAVQVTDTNGPVSDGFNGAATGAITVRPALSGTLTSSADSAQVMQPITFSVNDAAGGKPPLAITWDTDGNGFNDGMGTSISPSFTTPGVKTVRAQIADSANPAHTLVLSKSVTISDNTCLKQAAFGLVEITTQGCLRNVGTAAAARYESGDAVKVNGILFPAPPLNRKFLAVAPTAADPGGRIGIAGTTIKLGSFTVFSGDVDWALPAGGKGDEKVVKTLTMPGGQKLFGLAVGGTIEVKLGWRADGTHYATFPLNVQLPDVFKTGPDRSAGGASGSAALRVDESGVKYDGLKLQVSNVYVGKLKVESVCFSYVPAGSQAVATCPVPSLGGAPFLTCNEDVNTDRWDGNAVLQLPTQSKTRLALFGGVANQRLSKLGGFVDQLGTSVPIVSGVYLSRVGVGLCVYPPPFKLKGEVGVTILPVGSRSTVGVNGYFLYTDAFGRNPWSLELGGDVSVLGRGLGKGSVIIRPTGSIDFSVQANFSLFSLVSIDGRIVGWLEIPRRTFNIDGTVRSCIRSLCANTDAVVSSTGLAGCLNLGTITYYVLVRNSNWKWYAAWRVHWEARHIKLEAGFGHRWSQSSVDLFGGSCNLGGYRAVRSSAAQSGNGRVFTIPPRTPALALNVLGRDGPPKVKLTGPGGQVVASPADAASSQVKGRYVLIENPTTGSTSILLVNPTPGRWTVEALDGGNSVVGMRISDFEAPPNFAGTVVKRAKGRLAVAMSYAVPSGAKFDLVERGGGVERVIARNARGRRCPGPNRPGGQTLLCLTKQFVPAFGPGGRRSILAVLSRGGVPMSTTLVARFVAPKPALPSRPGRLRLGRRGSTVIVAFDRSSHAASHTLSFALSTGKRFGVQSRVGCRAVLITGVPRSVSVAVRVAGVRRDFEVGRYATASLARDASRAGNRAALPARTCTRASGA